MRTGLRLGLILVLVWLIHLGMEQAMYFAEALPNSQRRLALPLLIALSLLAYALLIAIPFVPGVEIGMALLMLQGAQVAPFVYLATLTGLMTAFFVGQYLPLKWLHGAFVDLRLRRAADLVMTLDKMDQSQRIAHLQSRLPKWLSGYAIRFRYLGLAALLNLPGSSVIGGGGGISLVAGLSGLFTARATLLTIALAVAPVPLIFWLR